MQSGSAPEGGEGFLVLPEVVDILCLLSFFSPIDLARLRSTSKTLSSAADEICQGMVTCILQKDGGGEGIHLAH